MNNDFATLVTLMILYFLFVLLALWWATLSIRLYIDQAVNLTRRQWNEDMRQHHGVLIADIRSATQK